MNTQDLKLAIVLCALVAMPALAEESIDQSWKVDAKVAVSVDNVAGEIEISGWDRNEAQLTGKLGDSVEELEINVTGSTLQITVINRDERNIDSTALKLRVPKGAGIEVSAVSADINVANMENEKLTASSVSGDVEIEVTSQWVSIESVSGDVEFNGSTARISAESVSGDVELSGISGKIEATTVSGDMEIIAGLIESGKFEAVSGDITITGALSDSGSLSAESMSGDVEISLPASQSGLFKAQSFSGRISTSFGTVKHAKHGPGSHLKYVSGDSGAEIRVESFSGNIKFQHD